MSLLFDARWKGDHGIGRFASEVGARLQAAASLEGKPHPASPFDAAYLSVRLLGVPKRTFFYSPGYSAPLLTRVPFVFTIHDLNHIDFAAARTSAKALYYERVMKPACRRAQAVVTVSEYSRQRICEWSGVDASRVLNVGNGVGNAFSLDGVTYAHRRPYVLCVGNRKPHKNEERTVAAFAQLATRLPHDLLFSGQASPELSAVIRAARLEDRVRFAGRLSDERLAGLYRGASLVVFASLYEGFGLPILEAMACGTAVVTSNVCSLPEVAGDAALIVDPTSIEEIAAAMERVLTDDQLARMLVERGLANIRRYSWQRTGTAVRELLERLCD